MSDCEQVLNTKYYIVDHLAPNPEVIDVCGQIIRAGGMLGFPTETVYGLGANALDGKACSRIFIAKGRPQDNPLIVHVSSPDNLNRLVSTITPAADKCLASFWPGPLTLVLPKTSSIPMEVTAGLSTVAVRMPDHPAALALIESAGVPIAAPSANLSGRPSPTNASHVLDDLNGRIEGVLDAGPCSVGIESTVLDLSGKIPLILRPGSISIEQLEEVLGEVQVDPGVKDSELSPRSPGVKYIHYAPKGELVQIVGRDDRVREKIIQELQWAHNQGLRVGILCTTESAQTYISKHPDYLGVLGSSREPWKAAAVLYSCLRECDQNAIDLIFTETYPAVGMGAALMNRLDKAAGNTRINV